MGIPRLTTRLQHKAQHSTWPVIGAVGTDLQAPSLFESKIAIIDGPGLAYHIFHCHVKALAGTKEKLGLCVDYGAIAARLIAFLDDIERRGFLIHNIFFDGALPPVKTATRLARLQSSAKHATALRISCEEKAKQTGCPHESHRVLSSAPWQSALWPPPPFLVPSLIEALITHSKYANITEVMPGEADHYCTIAARELASTGHTNIHIFTNDSDLLVTNTQNDTKVVMLASMTYNDSMNLSADVFEPAVIVNSVGLTEMLKVAYRMKIDPLRTFDVAAALVLQNPYQDLHGYEDFLAEFEYTTDHAPLGIAQQQCRGRMDPRLSELVCQIVQDPSEPEPSMFLPFTVDDIHRASAWKCGSSLRRLAYTVLIYGYSVKDIREFDRKGDRVASTKIEPYDDLHQALRSHHAWLLEQISLVQSRGIQKPWRAIAAITLFSDLQTQGKPAPSLTDMADVVHKQKRSSWTQIHLAAQLDAVMYSFRMLKLSLEFVLAEPDQIDNSQAFVELFDQLVNLPSILHLFDMPPGDSCDAFCDLIRTHCVAEKSPVRPRKRVKRVVSATVPVRKERPGESEVLASNPFAMLSE